MSIWKTRPITEVPEILLSRWRIYETENGERHFVGFNLTEGEGRVSSAIKEFDKDTMQGVTRSGRVYKLYGAAGWDSDADYTWKAWKRINDVIDSRDVTSEVVFPVE